MQDEDFKPYEPVIVIGLLNLSNEKRYDTHGIFIRYKKNGECVVQVDGCYLTMAIGRVKRSEKGYKV